MKYFLGIDTSTTSSKALIMDERGEVVAAAGSLQWYRDAFTPNMSFDDLLHEAESIPAGSEGLQFLPYLSGERTPHPDPLARGAFIGLTLRHGRAHMTRAVLEAELVTVNTSEGAAYGAAILASVGAGAWTDAQSACKAAVKITGSAQPVTGESEAYRKSYAVYRELYPALKDSFGKM